MSGSGDSGGGGGEMAVKSGLTAIFLKHLLAWDPTAHQLIGRHDNWCRVRRHFTQVRSHHHHHLSLDGRFQIPTGTLSLPAAHSSPKWRCVE